jgi:hypothetical protein
MRNSANWSMRFLKYFFFDDILLSRNIVARFEIVWNANIAELNFLILSFINRVHLDSKESLQDLYERHKIIFLEEFDFFVAHDFYQKAENFNTFRRFLLHHSSRLYRRQTRQRIINFFRKN